MTSINCQEEDTKIREFKKPLLLKDCLISFEPHKGIEGSQKNLINSLKSQAIYDLHSIEDDKGNGASSFPPMGFHEKEVRILKNSDNLRSVDRGKNPGLLIKLIKKK
jgi:hypothetical protein